MYKCYSCDTIFEVKQIDCILEIHLKFCDKCLRIYHKVRNNLPQYSPNCLDNIFRRMPIKDRVLFLIRGEIRLKTEAMIKCSCGGNPVMLANSHESARGSHIINCHNGTSIKCLDCGRVTKIYSDSSKAMQEWNTINHFGLGESSASKEHVT